MSSIFDNMASLLDDDTKRSLSEQVRRWFVNPPPHGHGGKLAIALADEHDRLTDILLYAAEHIESILPRPGPYHPTFAAVLAMADKIKKDQSK